MDDFIERRIVTGLIVSTPYLQEITPLWNLELVSSPTAAILASWCFEYFNKYRKAPGRDIEGIYNAKRKDGLPKDQARDIEEILSTLSADYEREQFNLDYLLDETKEYFKGQHLKRFAEGILYARSTIEGEQLAASYTPLTESDHTSINPFTNATRIKQAFAEREHPLITFPKALGEFWNSEFVRGGFLSLMAPEKRGKTYMLMEIALQGMRSKNNVVFFQAGDMSENQQIRRLCVYLAKKSDQLKYCKGMFLPEVDCYLNQIDECAREQRECNHGVFSDEDFYRGIRYEDLKKAHEENPDYKSCRNCDSLRGAVWFKWHEEANPLQWKEAYKKARRYQKRHKQQFKLCTYPNETLTVSEIKSLLDTWERLEGFVADLIVIDYADILAPDADCRGLDFRNQTNRTWQRLRGLSQQKHCLLVTATQSDAASYDREILRRSNFSEDKRKYAHVTAMYGLNQTEEEKRIGIMRINELVVREGEFYESRQVKILQRLQIGRPLLGSFK